MVKAHIVNHTHWDREWYFTSGDALVLSEQLFTDVVEELLRHPEASFVLDGQLSILDDYVALHPEKLADIKLLIKEKRLFIGPWFTQTDAFFAHGESILRNLMVGVYESKKYGEYMEIGYLPDTFGFNAQIPVLMEQAGLDNIIFWRGLHLGKHVKSPYFKWSGLAGDVTIHAINMPHGYGTGMLLEPTHNYVDGRLDPAIDFIKKHSQTSEVLIPSGNDQLNIISDFANKIEGIKEIGKHEYQMSTYQEFIAYVKSLEDLETYQGEFREPVLARVHKTIGSSRMNIKLMSDQLEAKLLRRIEPLLVIAQKSGIQISTQLLINTWKKLLEGQAHDSLAGCVSDTVTADIMHRMKEADEISDSIENTIVKKIADSLKLSNQEILVFNTDPVPFTGFKTIQVVTPTKEIGFASDLGATIVSETYIDARQEVLEETPAGNRFIEEPGYYVLNVQIQVSLPALGYQVIAFSNEETKVAELIESSQLSIKNEAYQINFESGKLNLLTSDGTVYNDFLSLTDEGNDGDTYDFSPLLNDVEIPLNLDTAKVYQSPRYQEMIISGKTAVPYDLDERLGTDFSGELGLVLRVVLEQGSQLVRVTCEIDNQVLSHRLRAKINVPFQASENIASLPFGYIHRTPGVPENWQETYSEMPIDIEPLESSVSITDNHHSVSLFTKGLKEYQQGENGLALTLLATTSELGKPNLLYRPGRASGDTTKKGHVQMLTPDAQLLGTLKTEFAVAIGSTGFSEKETADLNHDYRLENLDYQLQAYNYFLYRIDNKIQKGLNELGTSAQLEIFALPKDYLVSACYPSYYHPGKFVLRIENPTKAKQILDSALFTEKNGVVVNALEVVEAAQTFEIRAYNAITILLDI